MDLCKTLASDEEVLSIFGNVSELFQFHTDFLRVLEKYKPFTTAVVALIFLKHFNFVELYKSYSVTSQKVYANLEKLEKKHPQLKNIIQVFFAYVRNKCDNLGI